MDFHELPKDRNGYDTALVLVDRFGKRTVSIPCQKTIDAKETARIVYPVRLPNLQTSANNSMRLGTAVYISILEGVHQHLRNQAQAFYSLPPTNGRTNRNCEPVSRPKTRAFVNYFQDNWVELLPIMDYANVTLPNSSTGFSLIELEMGDLPRTSFG
jgi:hypothetical protein